MTHSAQIVLQNFSEIILAYGQSDEYSFIFRKKTETYNRRARFVLYMYDYEFVLKMYIPQYSICYSGIKLGWELRFYWKTIQVKNNI